MSRKKLVAIVAGVVGALTLAAAAAFLVLGGSSEAIAAGPVEPVHREGKLGPHIVVADRVYNLASSSSGTRHFTKIALVIEFETFDPAWFDLTGEPLKLGLEEFTEEIGTGRILIEDAIGSIVSSRTAEELRSTSGREALRDEIKAAVQARLPEPAIHRVFFTSLIVD